jgi:carbamoyl-phosphate synthase large subunit
MPVSPCARIGFETVMVNSNPETVSTDYDTSDRLYFEPLTLEDVLEIYRQEGCWRHRAVWRADPAQPRHRACKANGVNIIGTSPRASRPRRTASSSRGCSTRSASAAGERHRDDRVRGAGGFAKEIGFPVLLRPSFVLGGRGMFIVYSEEELKHYIVRQAFEVMPDKPVLIDNFLEDAIELDVDCISDGETSVIGLACSSTSSSPACTRATPQW